MKKIYLSTILCLYIGFFSFNSFSQNSIKIGKLIWMTQNLNVSTFRNGDAIPEAKNKLEWLNAVKAKKPAWCFKDFDSKNGVKYGKLYNYYAVEDPRGLAPKGWLIPHDEHIYDLQLSTNSNAASGSKFKSKSGWKNYSLKEKCPLCEGKTIYCSKCQGTGEIWVSYSGNGTNQTSFSAVPGGSIDHNWGATYDEDNSVIWIYHHLNIDKDTVLSRLLISYDNSFLIQGGRSFSDPTINKGQGFSVRCICVTQVYLDE
jgi:hypothetical protein